MAVTSIDHFNIAAPWNRLIELKRFYTEVVGLAEGARPKVATRGFWLYADKQAVLHLVEDEGRRTGEAGYLDHVAFKCRGLSETKARLEANGVKYNTATIKELNQTQLFFFCDPVGTGVELNFDECI